MISNFAELEDDNPYQSRQQHELTIFATNDEKNSDLKHQRDAELRKKFSSLEDGEVRDDDDDEESVTENNGNLYARQ
jgi:hypothetical protein